MTIHLGKREVVFTETLILKDAETAECEVQILGDSVRFTVTAERGAGALRVRWKGEEEKFVIELQGGADVTTGVTSEPVEMATLDTGEKIFVVFAYLFFGNDSHVVQLQLMLGKKP